MKDRIGNVNRMLLLTLVVALLALVGCGEAPEPSDGELATASAALSSAETFFADARGNQQIAYHVVGSGPQDVVLVHGWMVDSTVYNNLVQELAGDDYRLISIDLRGTGASSKPNGGYSLENYLKDVEAVIAHAGAQDYVLVGHSMGGAIAQRVAARNDGDLSGLVLMSPVPASGFPLPPEFYDLFRAAAHDSDLKRFILTISSLDMDPADLEEIATAAEQIPPRAIEQSLDAWTGADFADMLVQINTPTMVLVSDDPFMPVPFLQAAVADPIANAFVEYFPGAGHYLQVEAPAETAASIADFISGL